MPEWAAGKPTGISVDDRGRVLVADTHYHRVVIFDRDGKESARFGSYGERLGQFTYPTSVAVDREGFLYVSEYGGNDRITRFTPDFEPVAAFGTADSGPAALSRPQSMTFDSDGSLWVADACHHRLCRFSREGQLLGTLGTAGRGPASYNTPTIWPSPGTARCWCASMATIAFSGLTARVIAWAPGARPAGGSDC
jgi:sugar lactone lactonase YvrE